VDKSTIKNDLVECKTSVGIQQLTMIIKILLLGSSIADIKFLKPKNNPFQLNISPFLS